MRLIRVHRSGMLVYRLRTADVLDQLAGKLPGQLEGSRLALGAAIARAVYSVVHGERAS